MPSGWAKWRKNYASHPRGMNMPKLAHLVSTHAPGRSFSHLSCNTRVAGFSKRKSLDLRDGWNERGDGALQERNSSLFIKFQFSPLPFACFRAATSVRVASAALPGIGRLLTPRTCHV
ncbi:unnamed protein product [Protopolystoma xenopodis]|uniref:Uncharacterized protein n=1 Tax=Protopolystoma xenopodis TaxID=117903 RepID=A0A3S5A7A2_9PLAT|nr:unnamed protein product [Protopolystoma xenopodis]